VTRVTYDAVVVGAGPNGLAAAIVLAGAGRSTLLVEANDTAGGALRSAPLTLPGFIHDMGAAIMPLAAASPFLSRLPLARYGVEWIQPPVAAAHPLDDGTAALLEPSLSATARGLGADGNRYEAIVGPLVADWKKLAPMLLGPPRLPRHPISAARLSIPGVLPITMLSRAIFRGVQTPALMAGLAAHSILPLDRPLTAGYALLFATLAHVTGWPFPRGGAQRLADALRGYFLDLGGEIETSARVCSLRELPPTAVTVLDLTPRQILDVAGYCLPPGYRHRLSGWRYGPGVFKVDYALAGPIPWTAPGVSQAATVHLGGALREIVEAEDHVAHGRHPDRPFVLVAQPSLFDPSRAPAGSHTAWAYCHVPNGSTLDMTKRVEAQIERFAPGFRDRVLARTVTTPTDLERMDANLVGGDISGGTQDLRQWLARPVPSVVPYRTPAKGLYICSSSTPPGAGVHGMCGYHAARAVLRDTPR